MAVDKPFELKTLSSSHTDAVAAVSVGLKDGNILVDLDYKEDSSADLDMNVVMTQSGQFLEIQGTEKIYISKEQINAILDAAQEALEPCFELQSCCRWQKSNLNRTFQTLALLLSLKSEFPAYLRALRILPNSTA